jgi:hypothetical protein
MSEQDLIFQQYKLYSEQKESFITRSFAINRFYLCLCIILLFGVYLTKTAIFAYSIPLGTLLTIIGMCCAILWWMNMDSYNMLIKIKFAKVLEEIEKKLPVQPYGEEYKEIAEYREKKKMFLFSDIQKTVAVIVFLMFFVSLIETIIPVIVKSIA